MGWHYTFMGDCGGLLERGRRVGEGFEYLGVTVGEGEG